MNAQSNIYCVAREIVIIESAARARTRHSAQPRRRSAHMSAHTRARRTRRALVPAPAASPRAPPAPAPAARPPARPAFATACVHACGGALVCMMRCNMCVCRLLRGAVPALGQEQPLPVSARAAAALCVRLSLRGGGRGGRVGLCPKRGATTIKGDRHGHVHRARQPTNECT